MLEIIQIPVLNDNYIYLIHEAESAETAVIDPAIAEPVIKVLAEKCWSLSYIFNTHHHYDHVDGNLQLKQLTGCKVIGSKTDFQRIPGLDIALSHGEQISLGSQKFEIIATPGHTLGHIVFYNAENQLLFCGDTLFSLGCGRLFEGTAEQMWTSLEKLMALPDFTKIYCAHEYTLNNGRFALTLEADSSDLQKRVAEVVKLRQQNQPTIPSYIGLEKATNPFLRPHSSKIRNVIGAKQGESNASVFAKIRQLKNQFN